MTDFLSRTFNIRKNEWPRFLLLGLMFFLYFIGDNWGETTALAQLYVRNVNLSTAFIANAIISIVFTTVYTALVDRMSNKLILIGILLLSAASVALGLGLLVTQQVDLAYMTLYIFARVIRSAFLLHWWTYVNSFYDTRAAKRIVPVLSVASRFAVIFAGISLAVLNSLAVSKQSIIVTWAGLLLTVAALVWLMPALLKEEKPPAAPLAPGEKRASFVHNAREGYSYVSQSPFLRWMAASTFVLVIVYSLLNPLGGKVFSRAIPDDGVTSYIAILNAATNALMLPVMLLFSRIVARIGLGNASLIYPVGTLAICLLFVAVGLPMVTEVAIPVGLLILSGSLAHFDREAFRFGLREPANDLLYNAVPLRVKGRTRAFINGLVLPISLLAGGIILRLPFLDDPFLYILLGVTAVLYMVTAVAIRGYYGQALVNMLEQEDFSFLMDQVSSPAIADAATIDFLSRRLDEATSADIKILVAQFLCEMAGSDSLPALARVAREGDAYTRASILNIITAADLRDDAARDLYTEFIPDPDPRVRQQAIAGLEEWAGADNEQFLSLAVELLQDEDLDVRAHVLPALVGSGDVFYLAASIQTLYELLRDADPHRRTVGIRVVGQTGDVRFIRSLVDYLKDPADQARLEAALAIERLAMRGSMPESVRAAIQEHMSPLLEHDPVEHIRLATLHVLARINAPESYARLTGAFGDISDHVRKEAVEALAQFGEPVQPVVEPLLATATGKMAAVVLARIAPEFYAGHTEAYIDDNLSNIYRNYAHREALAACRGYPSIGILYETLTEQNYALAEEIFYLLAATHKAEDVARIAESLRSPNARARANAAEALEALANPHVARLTAPLFDPEATPRQLLELGAELVGEHPDAASVLRDMLGGGDVWLRGVATFALGDLMTFTPEAPPEAADEPLLPREPARQAVTLLDELADSARAGLPETRLSDAPERATSKRSSPLNLADWMKTTAKDEPGGAEPAPPDADPEAHTRATQDFLARLVSAPGASLPDAPPKAKAAEPRQRDPKRGLDLLDALAASTPDDAPKQAKAKEKPAQDSLDALIAGVPAARRAHSPAPKLNVLDAPAELSSKPEPVGAPQMMVFFTRPAPHVTAAHAPASPSALVLAPAAAPAPAPPSAKAARPPRGDDLLAMFGEPAAGEPRRAAKPSLEDLGLAGDAPADSTPEDRPTERAAKLSLEDLGLADGLLAMLDDAESQPAEAPAGASRRGRIVTGRLDTGLLVASTLPEAAEVLAPGPADQADRPCRQLFTLHEIHLFLEQAREDPAPEVRIAAAAAGRLIAGTPWNQPEMEEAVMLSTIEKVIFLKKVPFFQGMKIDHLKVLASICEEQMFTEDKEIFHQGDPGGALYVVVNGRVGIEREGKRKGSTVRVATVGVSDSFGEITLFDGSPRNASAIALQDTLTLKLRREPITELARQYPDLSLQLINVLSKQLREANDRIAELAPSRPRELHKVFDRLD
ncbi:MAG: HEAT repeat domain-containing protein [Anaerolineae bacterium]|nr:HEAT repeat domain-containing protein [Anaerolineae bacterium]